MGPCTAGFSTPSDPRPGQSPVIPPYFTVARGGHGVSGGRSEPCLSKSVPECLPSARATFSLCDLGWLLSLSELPFLSPCHCLGSRALFQLLPLPCFNLSLPTRCQHHRYDEHSTRASPRPVRACRPSLPPMCLLGPGWTQTALASCSHPHPPKIRSSKRCARQTPKERFQGGLLTFSRSVGKPGFSRMICMVPEGLENQTDMALVPRRVPVPRVRWTFTHSGAMLRTRSPKRVQRRSPAQTQGSGWRPWGPPEDRPGAQEHARASLSPRAPCHPVSRSCLFTAVWPSVPSLSLSFPSLKWGEIMAPTL